MKIETKIKKEIDRLVKHDWNFVVDNYGSEGADNGEYSVYFSETRTRNTLEKFAEFILSNTDQQKEIKRLTSENIALYAICEGEDSVPDSPSRCEWKQVVKDAEDKFETIYKSPHDGWYDTSDFISKYPFCPKCGKQIQMIELYEQNV